MSNELSRVPVVILCGGRGVILGEEQKQRTNKALIRIHGQPLIYWVMQRYALYGATEFILVVGFQAKLFGKVLQEAGARVQENEENLFALNLANLICQVKLVVSPPVASTGSRLLACHPVLERLGKHETFAVSYSDTLSDIDLGAEMRFHKKHGLVATMATAKLPVRFRILGIRTGEVLVRGFAERPVIDSVSINGGYYLFNFDFWRSVSNLGPNVALENQPLEQLAADSQLAAYSHNGAWQTCDAERDLLELNRLAQSQADMVKG